MPSIIEPVSAGGLEAAAISGSQEGKLEIFRNFKILIVRILLVFLQFLGKDVTKDDTTSTDERLPIHADELPYLFEPRPPLEKFFKKIGKDSTNYDFSKSFVSLWASFAKDG